MAQAQDGELQKAFAELHAKVIDTRQNIKIADLQIDGLKRTKQRAELTQIELRGLPSETRFFQSVGRMFLLQDIKIIRKEIEEKQKAADEKIKNLENTKTYLQRSCKESENNIREMIQKRKNAS